MRAWMLVLLLLPAFAGCAGDASESEPEAEPEVVTDPTDYSYLDSGEDGSGYHIHDYWRGQERLDIMDASLSTGSNNCDGCDDHMRVFRFRPDEGQTVPQGTANVTVSIDWQENENADHGGAQLWIKTAAQSEPTFVADIVPGSTIVVPSSHDENDPPHHVLSLWEFWFVTKGRPSGGSTFGGTVSMQASVERGLEIPPWPPHPDLWAEGPERELLTETRMVSAWTELSFMEDRIVNCMGPDCVGFHRLDEGAIVPWDAGHVEVTLTYEHASMPSVPDLQLWFHGADTWSLAELSPEDAGPQQQVYVLQMDPKMGDSPYAKQSLWEFFVTPGGVAGQGHFTGSYTLEATAVRSG